jgi:predicted Zn-dependent protease
VRLAEALIDLNCDHTAAVLSSHAIRLDPTDQVVQRNRIATLTNLGEVGAALELLGKVARESGDGWFSAVRAIVLKVSAGGVSGPDEAARLDEARNAANDALRMEPQNLWYHLVRADVLLRTGKADLAEEDFEYLWRESRLDQSDGLSFATRAAIELQLGADAVALSTKALNVADATVGDYGTGSTGEPRSSSTALRRACNSSTTR